MPGKGWSHGWSDGSCGLGGSPGGEAWGYTNSSVILCTTWILYGCFNMFSNPAARILPVGVAVAAGGRVGVWCQVRGLGVGGWWRVR